MPFLKLHLINYFINHGHLERLLTKIDMSNDISNVYLKKRTVLIGWRDHKIFGVKVRTKKMLTNVLKKVLKAYNFQNTNFDSTIFLGLNDRGKKHQMTSTN